MTDRQGKVVTTQQRGKFFNLSGKVSKEAFLSSIALIDYHALSLGGSAYTIKHRLDIK
ncbi:MAG: hypothetical protein AB2989_06520 [Candidatus Symbiodolus clandestinus]